ncbi:hypothetical protein [Dethiosulfovibrio peptidovorans]|uniref:hypothetical protein n=1 Tax=Dethiosulfovibrio peptidovorans TaxID=47055 RepID=UPI0012EA852F|nr:hypothetical protein [Dethiosulfovibrio peptidovorans]
MEKLLSFKEVAGKAGLGESRARTLRERYLKAVPFVGEGRSRRYTEVAASVLSRADELEKQGKRGRTVLNELLGSGSEYGLEDLKEVIENLEGEVAFLKGELSSMRRESSSLRRRVFHLESRVVSLETSGWNLRDFLRSILSFLDEMLDF